MEASGGESSPGRQRGPLREGTEGGRAKPAAWAGGQERVWGSVLL